ncbi:hypothetical protein EYF80_023089 [Liparis tanakae]|uniref:Uncharacterized protein n=1 Tax=Liparis tanakae TaxID=230148 RepID=A0A4Z2HMA5_9TELE|nr:hypothetical protein EYF80_023089 [Liparis tanakae]
MINCGFRLKQWRLNPECIQSDLHHRAAGLEAEAEVDVCAVGDAATRRVGKGELQSSYEVFRNGHNNRAGAALDWHCRKRRQPYETISGLSVFHFGDTTYPPSLFLPLGPPHPGMSVGPVPAQFQEHSRPQYTWKQTEGLGRRYTKYPAVQAFTSMLAFQRQQSSLKLAQTGRVTTPWWG